MPVGPRLRAPAGAWDTHVHLFDPRFPVRPDTVFQPPVATARDYAAVQRRLGTGRTLVVQSSAHGTDHSGLLDGIALLGPSARGIGMVDAEVSDAELRRLTRGGVRGARFLMVPGGMLSWHELEPLAARIQQVGWHVNLQLDGHELAERADLIARLPGQIIIDHLGMFGRPVSLDHPSVLALLHLLESGRVWVKLSAPYAGGGMGGPPYPAAGVLARALVHHAPERLMWGSNWPHPFTTQVRGLPAEDDAMLLDLLLNWAEDASARHRILVDNPAALFETDPILV